MGHFAGQWKRQEIEEALPGGWGGGPMSLVWILKSLVSVFINASRRCRNRRNFRKGGWRCAVKKTLQFCNYSVNNSRIQHPYITIHNWHNSQGGPLKFTDKRRSLKRKENWRKLLLLGIQTNDKLAKPPFFVDYSRLCRHCRNLAAGGCLLSPFHFTLFRYFLSHVACWNLPWQGLTERV